MTLQEIKDFVNRCKDAKLLSDLVTVACDQPRLSNCGSERLLPEGPRGNIFLRPMNLGLRGNAVQGEQHNFDHVLFVIKGAVLVREGHQVEVTRELPARPGRAWRVVDGRSEEVDVTLPAGPVQVREWVGPVAEHAFGAGTCKLIRAELWHECVSLEDGTIAFCVFAHRDPDGNIIQSGCGFSHGYV